MNNSLPNRKPTRLKDFDYSSEDAYFITICTHNKQKILCDIVGDGVYDIPKTNLSQYGNIVFNNIQKINLKHTDVRIDKYVIMPNHIHLIIKIFNSPNNGLSQAPNPTNATIPKFISLFKRCCNREIGHNIFQRSFHDHVIRSEKDYLKIWNYIDTNPAKWESDCFYL